VRHGLVIDIHGGLVNKTSGLAGAQRLDSYYCAASVLPVFPVWESGFFEAVQTSTVASVTLASAI
jgi:hypothetical protein